MADDVPENVGHSKTAVAQDTRSVAGKVKTFVADVITEIRKTSWPTRQELVESTWVVIVMVLALGLFIFICDWILINLQAWLLPRG